MPTIFTRGGPSKRTQFCNEGDFDNGITILFASGPTRVTHGLLNAAIDNFRGTEVKGGFSMTNPISGGFGQWVQTNSRALNVAPLTPRHASFIAAILREMGYLKCRLTENTVI